METIIILATGSVAFFIGLAVGKVRTTDIFAEDVFEVERTKRINAEFEKAQLEKQLRNYGTCFQNFSCSATHTLQLDQCYRKGFYDAQKEESERKLRFRTLEEAQQMFDKLSSAMKPLETLKKELNSF